MATVFLYISREGRIELTTTGSSSRSYLLLQGFNDNAQAFDGQKTIYDISSCFMLNF